ncbi:hypothetical protein ODJ79_12310 [Actinoplanes sp. KI2]|uniref:hypothetical protein n=1 Tax=Actinoplanes sp. KI2 TaxID=2983315 RepID=UPI0021D5DCDD|nr:hypothetical protein [Actinoplanes sp. KI2]MCU7724501.1 hypothetical protein [Actinoplanes sp. KI2]
MNDDNLERRLSSLERRVNREARLRASVDHDLSRLEEQQRHTTSVVQAIRETQVEHGEQLTRLEKAVAGHGDRFTLIDRKLKSLDSALDLHDVRVLALEFKVDRLDTKVDRLDTKVTGLDTKVDQILTLLEPPSGGAVETN